MGGSATKPTICVYLASPEFVRNYAHSGALSELALDFRIVAAVPHHLRDHPGLGESCFSEVLPVNAGRAVMAVESLLQDARTHRFRAASSSFLYRHERLSERAGFRQFAIDPRRLRLRPLQNLPGFDRILPAVAGPLAALLSVYHWLLHFHDRSGRYWVARLLSVNPLWTATRCFELFPQRWANAIVRRLRSASALALLVPSNAFEPTLRPLLRASRRHGVQSVLLVDNWDNLSSKMILSQLPDHMGVWGEQSRRHAIEIQGMPADRVHILGSPRFSAYLGNPEAITAGDVRSGSDDNEFMRQKLILFAGCSVPFLEIPVLECIEAWISTLVGEIPIVEYRPHPQRHKRNRPDEFRPENFRHIIGDRRTDPRVMRDEVASTERVASPKLSCYAGMFDRYHFVISSPTSLVIESLLNRKRVVLLGIDDGVHLTTPATYLRRSTHFEGVESTGGVTVVRDEDTLLDALRRLLALSDGEARTTDEEFRTAEYFCLGDLGGYSGRLRLLVRTIIMQDPRPLDGAATPLWPNEA
jgi:hypothetical protein